MVYRMQDRLRKNSERFAVINTENVTYTREGVDLVIPASPILCEAIEIIPGVATTRIEIQDWGIDVADIDFGDGINTPLLGDTLTRADGSIYRPMDAGENKPAWRYVTSAHERVLLRTTQLGLPT